MDLFQRGGPAVAVVWRNLQALLRTEDRGSTIVEEELVDGSSWFRRR